MAVRRVAADAPGGAQAIRFVSQDGAHDLAPGDRLEIAAGTDHSATVGPEGVECMEAFR